MDNYDEHMNYTFEPSEEPDEPKYSASENTAPQEEKPKKKHGKTAALIAVVLAVAIVAGAGGSVLTNVIHSISENNAKQTMAASEEAKVEGESYTVQKTSLPTTLSSNDGDYSLTPKEVYSMNVNAVVNINDTITTTYNGQTVTGTGAGSGFIISEDGYILTNAHVVEDATDITVQLYSGDEYPAEVVGSDTTNDVALLKIDATGLQPVTVADSDEVEVGDECVAIGNALGKLSFSMTAGYVSALDREFSSDEVIANVFQIDVAINSGNSGGPLFDMNGNVIGITNGKSSGTTSTGVSVEGIGYAIPINDALKIAYDLQQYGYVRDRAFLGVTVRNLDSTTASTYGLPVGPMVQSVNEGSCAEKAGLQQGDIIIKLGDTEIDSYTNLVAALSKYSAGDTVSMTIYRSGAEKTLTVTLDEKPQTTDTTDTSDAESSDQSQPQDNGQQGQDGGDDQYYYYYYGNDGSGSQNGYGNIFPFNW